MRKPGEVQERVRNAVLVPSPPERMQDRLDTFWSAHWAVADPVDGHVHNWVYLHVQFPTSP